MPLPRAYAAGLPAPPVSSRMVGVPPPAPTKTFSLKTTCTSTGRPAPYVPSADPDVTFSTVGTVVSGVPITIPRADSDSGDPIGGSVRSAGAPVPESVMPPPPAPIASDDLFAYSSAGELSPSTTV